MKKTLTANLVLVAILSFMLGCDRKSEQIDEITTIDLGEAIKNKTELTLSRLGTKVTYVPLETTERSLIGDKPENLLITDEYIVVSNPGTLGNSGNSGSNCLLFDRKSGDFLNSLGHRGQDPEAYMSNTPAWNKKKGCFVFPGMSNNLVMYSPDDKFEGSMQLPFSSRNLNYFIFNEGDAIIYTGAMFNNPYRELFRISPDGLVLDSLDVVNDSTLFSVNVADITSMSILRSPAGSFIVMGTKSGIDKLLFLQFPTLWKCEGQVRFMELFTDTIYDYNENNTLTPRFAINMGEKGIKLEELKKKNLEEDTPIILVALENESKILFHGRFGLTQNGFVAIYDKDTKSTLLGEAHETGLKNDIDGFAPVRIECLTEDGKYAGLLTMDAINEWLEENPGFIFPENLKWMNDLPEDANPVLVIIE